MGTRAATFNAKIRNLKDYHYRITNNLSPTPSGIDVANTLKYFSQTLLSVLKDVPSIPQESYGPRQRDSVRLSVFPNLNYSGLYQVVLEIIGLVPTVQYGVIPLGEAILHVLGCLVPFLEYDLLDALPYTVASTLATFPHNLQKETISLLCTNILPMTLGYADMNENPTYATDSTAAIIMMVFQYIDNGCYHSQVIESLMSMKKYLYKDLLCVIAYGPPASRAPAVNLLFHYWPQLNKTLTDRRGVHYKYYACLPICCQKLICPNSGNVPAVKTCLDPALTIQMSDKGPPLYVCSDCSDMMQHEHAQFLTDVLLPIQSVSLNCDNKNCTYHDKLAVATCFSLECASFNGYRPIRYCAQCHAARHDDPKNSRHIVQTNIPDLWSCDNETRSYIVEAIVSLLKEAQAMDSKRSAEMDDGEGDSYNSDDVESENEDSEDRKLLSRYGIWLLVELCKPKDDIPIEVLGRLLGMLFQWFDATSYLPDDPHSMYTQSSDTSTNPVDNVGTTLEKLKSEYIYSWLQDISKTHFEVILSCLLPHPMEYARVGGHWDTLSTRKTQIKEGLQKLVCLIPYDIVTYEVWDYIIPYWLESIRTEITKDQLPELKTLLSKLFDIEMGPLPFLTEKIYHFARDRLEDTPASVQEQTLQWLQILSSVDIVIPMKLLLSIFKTGIQSLSSYQPEVDDDDEGPSFIHKPQFSPTSPLEEFFPGSPLTPNHQGAMFRDSVEHQKEGELNLTCCIMMVDIVIKQIETQKMQIHMGIYNETCKEAFSTLTEMLRAPWEGVHTCGQGLHTNGEGIPNLGEEENNLGCNFCETIALWHQLSMKLIEMLSPRLSVRIPQKGLPSIEEITAKNNVQKGIARSNKVKKENENSPEPPGNDDTSQGVEEKKTEEEPEPIFDISSLPVHLQLLHEYLKELDTQTDSEALYNMLKGIKFLCLHSEVLNYSLNEHEDFVKFCMKKTLIPSLWKLLQAEHSQIALVCVPLLLHCLTLPSGSDILWHLVETDFTDEDWRSRFAAVEKVTVLARLIEAKTIKNNQQIMTSLAHTFCHLISSLDDMNPSVVTRTRLYIETIKSSSVKCICQCLEFQFDSVIDDRTMILQRMYQFSTILKDQPILTWDFFLNRFDTLSLEAQLDLESSGDIAFPTDLKSSNRESEHFLRKINRARFALARTDSVRSVCGSIYGKPPYRRAASVPLHLINRTALPKEKPYTRQQSAPQFTIGGSTVWRRPSAARCGTSMFSNYIFPGGHLREFTDEESNFAALLQRAMDLEGVDRETVHHLVTLLLKFMVNVEVEDQNEEQKVEQKDSQSIVLRHLNVLLGYNQTEKAFSVPPYKLRSSAVFNAYLSGVCKVLDMNFPLGNILLPVSMNLLQYCPSPQRYASDFQPPNYTLWYLEPHTRKSWLKTLLVILYKYQYGGTSRFGSSIQTLVRIALNTIDAQHHRCRQHDDGYGPSSPIIPRNRDASNISAGDLENILETETPPQSPLNSPVDEPNVTISISPSSKGTVLYQKLTSDGTPVTSNTATLTTSVTDDTDTTSSSAGHERGVSPKRRVTRPPRRLPDYSFDGSDHDNRLVSSGVSHSHTNGIHNPASPSSPVKEMRNLPIVPQWHKEEAGGSPLLSRGTSTPKPVTTSTVMKFDNKRTLEKSFEEHIMAMAKGEDDQALTPSPQAPLTPSTQGAPTPSIQSGATTPSTTPSAQVEKKMVEQIQEFESQESRKSSSTDKPPLDGTMSLPSTMSTGDTLHPGSQTLSESDRDDLSDQEGAPKPHRINVRHRKARKTGLTNVELQKMIPELNDGGEKSDDKSQRRRTRKADLLKKSQQSNNQQKKAMQARYSDQTIVDRCPECMAVLEQYDEDTISLAITVCATFVHREPSLAVPMLLDMLQSIGRVASQHLYPWQTDCSLVVPGNCVSVARQFLRCVLHQLAPNGIFVQIFQSNVEEGMLMKTIANALMDFNELNCYAPLQLLLEGLNAKKTLPSESIMLLLTNLAEYMDCITLESSTPIWANILAHFDSFFRRLPGTLPCPCDMTPVLRIITAVLKIPGITSVKGILEPFSKLLSFTIQNCTFKMQELMDICSLCSRAFTKERDKLYLSRSIVFELVQALKFKSSLPDENLLMLVQFVCVDAGGTISPNNILEESLTVFNPQSQLLLSTNASECMKLHLTECVDFIADLHTVPKVKVNMKNGSQSLNEDTLGSQLKSGVAQFIALEFTKCNGRDNRAINRYLPWLYHPPSAMQQGPKEFIDCVGHIRLLSWLLLGSLIHTAVTQATGNIVCQPIPLEASTHIADHIMVIMTGFAEQSKASVLHMSSLFHAFILCQLWTMYCECAAALHPQHSEDHHAASVTIMDFWGRVTPGVLQLLSHSKVLAEMVNLHFLSLMEALHECNSAVLCKLLPMWTQILYSYHGQLQGNAHVRLQTCQNWEPPKQTKDYADSSFKSTVLLKWLKKLEFKMGQIECQSSNATQLYMYTV
ncbi:unnamed protein product [Owenia fusiformis]|uniref:Protein unc-79 homolog n=1 Tax=Owenia fusiformis TaxID=6347 RepID=A0A8S4PDD8_OWEFU|nr:unnamed protein product [Owenia fusiformis]